MELSAQKRKLNGKKVASLRRKGNIPAVLFSRGSSRGEKEVLNLTLNLSEFKKVYKEVGESALIKLNIEDGETVNILISDVQVEPLNLEPIHVGLFEVDMKQEIDAEVPVIVINEDKCPPIESAEGILITVLSYVEVRCLPQNIPHELEADASQLKEVGAVLTVADLPIDTSKVEVLTDMEEVVVKVDFAQQLEESEDGPTDVSDVGVITAKEVSEPEDASKKADSDKE